MSIKGCPHTTGRQLSQETPIELRTLVKFHNRFQENAYPYCRIYRNIDLEEPR
jgi:hypothetical protein